jgi:hypothetical protein
MIECVLGIRQHSCCGTFAGLLKSLVVRTADEQHSTWDMSSCKEKLHSLRMAGGHLCAESFYLRRRGPEQLAYKTESGRKLSLVPSSYSG